MSDELKTAIIEINNNEPELQFIAAAWMQFLIPLVHMLSTLIA